MMKFQWNANMDVCCRAFQSPIYAFTDSRHDDNKWLSRMRSDIAIWRARDWIGQRDPVACSRPPVAIGRRAEARTRRDALHVPPATLEPSTNAGSVVQNNCLAIAASQQIRPALSPRKRRNSSSLSQLKERASCRRFSLGGRPRRGRAIIFAENECLAWTAISWPRRRGHDVRFGSGSSWISQAESRHCESNERSISKLFFGSFCSIFERFPFRKLKHFENTFSPLHLLMFLRASTCQFKSNQSEEWIERSGRPLNSLSNFEHR